VTQQPATGNASQQYVSTDHHRDPSVNYGWERSSVLLFDAPLSRNPAHIRIKSISPETSNPGCIFAADGRDGICDSVYFQAAASASHNAQAHDIDPEGRTQDLTQNGYWIKPNSVSVNNQWGTTLLQCDTLYYVGSGNVMDERRKYLFGSNSATYKWQYHKFQDPDCQKTSRSTMLAIQTHTATTTKFYQKSTQKKDAKITDFHDPTLIWRPS